MNYPTNKKGFLERHTETQTNTKAIDIYRESMTLEIIFT